MSKALRIGAKIGLLCATPLFTAAERREIRDQMREEEAEELEAKAKKLREKSKKQ